MTYIFLDTNVLIHFLDFEQIDWNEVIGSVDEITIVIAPTIVDELDKHKYNSNKKISKRVKKLLPKIENFIEDPSKCKYNLIYIERKPIDEVFLNHSLDKREQDDCILASVLEFSLTHINHPIIYITNDVGPRLKAKRLNITAIRPPEKFLLSEEADSSEKEIALLQKEILSLKNKMPVLKVFFDQDLSIMSPDLSTRKKISKEEFVNRRMEEIKLKYSRMYYYPPDLKSNNPLMQFAQNPMFSPSEQQIKDYNDELEKFFKQYEEFANSLYDLYLVEFNSIEIKFVVKNIGTAPAEDIDLDFHFPDGFILYAKGSIPAKTKKKPEPPSKPKSRLDLSFGLSNQILSQIHPKPFSFLEPKIELNVSKPGIKRTNSYDVNFHIRVLKHHQIEQLEMLYIKYEDIALAKGFTIDYKIIAANIPNIVTGQLHVKI